MTSPTLRPAGLAYCSALALASASASAKAVSRAFDTRAPVSSRLRLMPFTLTALPPALTANPMASPALPRSRSLAGPVTRYGGSMQHTGSTQRSFSL